MADKISRLTQAVQAYGPNRQVALALGVSAQSVGKWLRTGSIEVENLHKLAVLSGYRFEWLAVGEGEPLQSRSPQHQPTTGAENVSPRSFDSVVERLEKMDQEGTLPDTLISSINNLLDSVNGLVRQQVSQERIDEANRRLAANKAKLEASPPRKFSPKKPKSGSNDPDA